MNLVPIIDLAAVLFDIMLLSLYLHAFLQHRALSKPLLALLYSAVIILYALSSIFLPKVAGLSDSLSAFDGRLSWQTLL